MSIATFLCRNYSHSKLPPASGAVDTAHNLITYVAIANWLASKNIGDACTNFAGSINYIHIATGFAMDTMDRLESIMLHNLLIMLFGISPIFCLLCSFLCLLGMHYADNLYL